MAIRKLSVMTFLILAMLICGLLGPAWGEQNPWSQANLYNVSTDSYYIPCELWTGAEWDGSKTKRLHEADLTFQGHKNHKGSGALDTPDFE